MTLYSDRSLLTQAGSAAAEWFSEQLGGASVAAAVPLTTI